MADESVTNTTTATKRGLERRSIHGNNDDDSSLNNNKSRKFRWSSCFSFITTKFKKPKSQKIRYSRSFDEFEHNKTYVPANIVPKTIQAADVVVVKATGTSWKQQQLQQQPTSSLSPPPRQTKNKRDSSISQFLNQSNDNTNNTKDRRPLVDPTLTPRVKPRSIKTKKQPSLLRLSLDAELLQQSPDGTFSIQDNDSTTSTCKTGHSSLSFTPTSTTQYPPFRSGTLGAVKNSKVRMSSHDSSDDIPLPPPLPKINITSDILHYDSRPNSQVTTNTNNSNVSYVTDSPVSMSLVEIIDDEEKLTLKERRHRRSPLSMPDTDQLTLALKGLISVEEIENGSEQELSQPPLPPLPPLPTKRDSQQLQQHYYESSVADEENDHTWRQQLLEQTIAFSLQNKSRQDAMLALEGKKPRALSLQPIVAVHELNNHFDTDDNTTSTTKSGQDVVKDKAQYDAIVSRTHKRQLSHDDRKTNSYNNYRTSLRTSESSANEKKIVDQASQLDIISENEIAHITTTTTPVSANKMLLFSTNGQRLSVTPETPPPHQQNAPSLISAPSTPNSFDSSVFDHDDYLNHDRLHHLAAYVHSAQ